MHLVLCMWGHFWKLSKFDIFFHQNLSNPIISLIENINKMVRQLSGVISIHKLCVANLAFQFSYWQIVTRWSSGILIYSALIFRGNSLSRSGHITNSVSMSVSPTLVKFHIHKVLGNKGWSKGCHSHSQSHSKAIAIAIAKVRARGLKK